MVTYRDVREAGSREACQALLQRLAGLSTAELRHNLLEGPTDSRGLKFLQRWGPTLTSGIDRRRFVAVLDGLGLKAAYNIEPALLEIVHSLAKCSQGAERTEAAGLLTTWKGVLGRASRCLSFKEARTADVQCTSLL